MKIDVVKLKNHLTRSNEKLVEILQNEIKFNVFQDTISDDSLSAIIEETGGYNYFRFETGGMNLSKDDSTITQEVLISFYSENRDDLDIKSIEIIAALHGKLFNFVRSKKYLIKKDNEDKYIDEIQFLFVRRMKNVC